MHDSAIALYNDGLPPVQPIRSAGDRTDESKVWLHHIEISDDEALVERYGVRIPVIVDGEGNELDCGFELERLSAWLRERGWLDEAALAELTALPDTTPPKGAHKRDGRRFLG
ncbi:hypothetical protein HORIV_19930 [Vreelandella olivaria]|uniref:Uncharacterized protein n=1 Tax=Vreelandella olivaria TaxID=390919 RepID=A0ABN5WRQ8_9GAMM|nr:hypothetical protein HORIV_19930 [Halomonas olivaria]